VSLSPHPRHHHHHFTPHAVVAGTLSVKRADFEKLITSNGGRVCKTVTNTVTHLVSSETGTQKCDDAEAKGVKIVTEDWVRNRIESGGGKDGGSEEEDDENGEEEDEEEEDGGGGPSEKLVGMVFAISGLSFLPSFPPSLPDCWVTGKLSVPRAEFEEFIKSNGGTVAKSVTRAVTHLVR
jgi:BRCT domain type II-containing protein